ncbi:MAG: hypothetical protein H0W64_08975 [Gammaproteobacteria bacterium]|nr:hypothetical protein [Gammaproteobacteria bacterium]
MGYGPPSLNLLIQSNASLYEKYVRHNPERDRLIQHITGIQNVITAFDDDMHATKNWESLKHKSAVGLYVLGMETISREYRLYNPIFKKRGFLKLGSTLYNLLFEQLGISKKNPLSYKDEVIYLEKLYNTILLLEKTDKSRLQVLLNNEGLELESIKERITFNIHRLLKKINNALKRTLESLPMEEVVERQLINLYANYKTKKDEKKKNQYQLLNWFTKPNKERCFVAQLAAPIAELNKRSLRDTTHEEDDFAREERIKLGYFMFITESIDYTYSFLRSSKHSDLCSLGMSGLQQQNLMSIHNRIKLDCLGALKTFLLDGKNYAEIERYGRIHFTHDNYLKNVDDNIKNIIDEIDKLTNRIKGTPTPKINASMIDSLKRAGILVSVSPLFGLGQTIGKSASETHGTIGVKVGISNTLNSLGKSMMGLNRNYLSFLAADLIVMATMGQMFAVVLQEMGLLLIPLGVSVATVAFDGSLWSLRALCKCYMDVYDECDPNLIKNVDPEFIRSLLNLPNDVFSAEKKYHLENLLDEKTLQIVTQDIQIHDDALNPPEVSIRKAMN